MRDTFGMSGNDESATLEQPTRCLLRSLPTAPRLSLDIVADGKPLLAIDVGKEAIWVMDPNTNALVFSAWLGQVTATPAKREYRLYGATTATPILDVCVPGLQRLTIGCIAMPDPFRHPGRLPFRHRYSWRGTVEHAENDPAYWVTGADWLTLVEKFGLAAQLEDRDAKRVKGYPWRSATESPDTPIPGDR
jgi:hypothetical protein